MTTLTSLPSDVIDTILSYSDITFKDIINLRCVCKQFRWIARTDEYCFYKRKFYQRWPSAKKYYDQQFKINSEQEESKKNKQEDKKRLSFIRTGIDCVRELRQYLPQVNLKHGKPVLETKLERKLLSEFEIMITAENYIKLVFFMDELKHLLTQPPGVDCDLTKERCYLKLFDYLRLTWRNNIIKKFNEEYPYKKLLEESATIFAQQLQLGKDVLYPSVKASLNNIALEARHFLKERHPEHSIFSTANEDFSHWENNKFNNDYWNEAEGTQIMDTLEEYMFGKLNFRPIYSKELEYMCIDYVLENKCGNELILYIIYHSVARRLGLRCDVVHKRNEIRPGLFWIPKYTFTENNRNDINFLNARHREYVRYLNINLGKFPDCLNKNKCFGDIHLTPFVEMISQILDAEFELYSRNGLSHADILAVCDKCPQVEDVLFSKRKSKEVKFAVGMIVTHGDESTDCSTGVIIGWHQNNFSDKEFYSRISHTSKFVMPLKICSNSNATEQRPYYIILTKSDKLCYVEEDAITLAEPNWIENRNTYRYFSKFKGTHYEPNENLATFYPHDTFKTITIVWRARKLKRKMAIMN